MSVRRLLRSSAVGNPVSRSLPTRPEQSPLRPWSFDFLTELTRNLQFGSLAGISLQSKDPNREPPGALLRRAREPAASAQGQPGFVRPQPPMLFLSAWIGRLASPGSAGTGPGVTMSTEPKKTPVVPVAVCRPVAAGHRNPGAHRPARGGDPGPGPGPGWGTAERDGRGRDRRRSLDRVRRLAGVRGLF